MSTYELNRIDLINTLHDAAVQSERNVRLAGKDHENYRILMRYTPDKSFSVLSYLIPIALLAAALSVPHICENVIPNTPLLLEMVMAVGAIYLLIKSAALFIRAVINTLKLLFGSVLTNKKEECAKAYQLSSDNLKAGENAFAQLCDRISIPQKYRNTEALLAFREYLQDGRVFTLEGPGGAYNLYEQELRMNTLNSRINSIRNEVNAVQQNQKNLNQSVQSLRTDMNNHSASISAKVSDISYTAGQTRDYAKSAEEDVRRIRELADRAARS